VGHHDGAGLAQVAREGPGLEAREGDALGGVDDQDGGPEFFDQVISGDYGHIVFSNNRQSLWCIYPGGWVTYYENAQAGNLTASYDLVSEQESVWLSMPA